MPPFAVIIPAAGLSSRFAGPRNKLLESLDDQPVILHTVGVFLSRADVRAIILPTTLSQDLARILPNDPRLLLCEGGPSRAHSVLNALREVDSTIDWVAVHDGARPLISRALIDATLAVAVQHGAAVPALPVSLTIKQATGPLPTKVEITVPRHNLWATQTPQIARRADLLRAFETCPIPLVEITDDVQLIELAGGQVWLVPGDERNVKITTQLDLQLARTLLSSK